MTRGPLKLQMRCFVDGEIISVECIIGEDETWGDSTEDDYAPSLFEYHFADIEAAEEFSEEMQNAVDQAKNYTPGPERPDKPCKRCGMMGKYHRSFGEGVRYCDRCIEIIMRLYKSDSVVFDKETDDED